MKAGVSAQKILLEVEVIIHAITFRNTAKLVSFPETYHRILVFREFK